MGGEDRVAVGGFRGLRGSGREIGVSKGGEREERQGRTNPRGFLMVVALPFGHGRHPHSTVLLQFGDTLPKSQFVCEFDTSLNQKGPLGGRG